MGYPFAKQGLYNVIEPKPTIPQLIAIADRALDYRLFRFEKNLNLQMVQLEYGADYLDQMFEKIIEELQTDKIIGYEET